MTSPYLFKVRLDLQIDAEIINQIPKGSKSWLGLPWANTAFQFLVVT